ncbi:hypothetical protein [Motiliproteus sp. SC1-56]|uniref:hypothetical protein n=1 Tax=Motiliproteus sp. SC1-56 TaxID=2799565 RepID=UPI001A8C60F2|nr:hypothetical protein [Motiliproteus sp. SC1-56]
MLLSLSRRLLLVLLSIVVLGSSPVVAMADWHGAADLAHDHAQPEAPGDHQDAEQDLHCGDEHCCSELCSAGLFPRLPVTIDAVTLQTHLGDYRPQAPPPQFLLRPPIRRLPA